MIEKGIENALKEIKEFTFDKSIFNELNNSYYNRIFNIVETIFKSRDLSLVAYVDINYFKELIGAGCNINDSLYKSIILTDENSLERSSSINVIVLASNCNSRKLTNMNIEEVVENTIMPSSVLNLMERTDFKQINEVVTDIEDEYEINEENITDVYNKVLENYKIKTGENIPFDCFKNYIELMKKYEKFIENYKIEGKQILIMKEINKRILEIKELKIIEEIINS